MADDELDEACPEAMAQYVLGMRSIAMDFQAGGEYFQNVFSADVMEATHQLGSLHSSGTRLLDLTCAAGTHCGAQLAATSGSALNRGVDIPAPFTAILNAPRAPADFAHNEPRKGPRRLVAAKCAHPNKVS